MPLCLILLGYAILTHLMQDVVQPQIRIGLSDHQSATNSLDHWRRAIARSIAIAFLVIIGRR